MLKFKNILFCTDYSVDAEMAFYNAFDQAKKYNAKLHILNVVMPMNPCGVKIFKQEISSSDCKKVCDRIDEKNRHQELGGLKKVYDERCSGIIDHEFIVKTGSPDVEILQYCEEKNIDMIILGTAGRSETERETYIRTAANVSKYADCQVITIGSPKQ